MIDHLGTAYDYGSIMHYAKTAFSKVGSCFSSKNEHCKLQNWMESLQNGKPTIVPKKDGAVIGQRRGFSSNDLFKINKLYACPSSVGELSGDKPQLPWGIVYRSLFIGSPLEKYPPPSHSTPLCFCTQYHRNLCVLWKTGRKRQSLSFIWSLFKGRLNR